MLKRLLLVVVFCAGVSAQAQVAVRDAQGRTLRGLAGSGALVTVVLNARSARDMNLQIVELFSDHFTFVQQNGERGSYRFSAVKEVRVQEGSVRSRRMDLNRAGILTSSDQDIAKRAGVRAFEIFNESAGNQLIRMAAAGVIAASKSENAANAIGYLQQLADGNDLPTAVAASHILFMSGEAPSEDTIRKGLLSGNRQTRSRAAFLASLTGDAQYALDIERLLRNSQTYPAAAIASARMGERSGLDLMIRGIRSLDEGKGVASVFALATLGGPEVIEAMQRLVETEQGEPWFRALRVLTALGDEEALELMRSRAMEMPEHFLVAAVLLAERGDREAQARLRAYISEPFDGYLEDLTQRMQVLTVLIQTGDVPSKNLLASIMNYTKRDVMARGNQGVEYQKEVTLVVIKVLGCQAIGLVGNRNLMSILPPLIEDPNPAIALMACDAAIAIANPEYHAKFVASAIDPEKSAGR